ncbi:hypothetical protein DL96DRAFT_1682699 [Flagelloscypha sp. PMI_526]|nr:hypothetical protein DL96DRAFT_1682699 [Flagelloscypha sp. PMI_526]
MRFFVILASTFAALISMASAASIHNRIVPQPSHILTRTDIVRRNTPSIIKDGGFEEYYSDWRESPWVYDDDGSERGDASPATPAHSGSHMGVLYTNTDGPYLQHSLDQQVTLTTRRVSGDAYCWNRVYADRDELWTTVRTGESAAPKDYTAQNITFTVSTDATQLIFSAACNDNTQFKWLIDDVALTVSSST